MNHVRFRLGRNRAIASGRRCAGDRARIKSLGQDSPIIGTFRKLVAASIRLYNVDRLPD